jgi:hypothetical protein
MANFEVGGLRFALQGSELKSTEYFGTLRGSKKRPTDLRCPQCEQPVTVKLSPTGKVIDHFAHYPDSSCPLKDHGESALHLNAKIGLAHEMERFHYASLIFQCKICTNWYPFLEINDYDSVKPECKFGNRRPDVSCLSSGETIGAAEVWHKHAVDQEKRRELDDSGIAWFEIPARSVHPQYYKHILGAHIFEIDAVGAGIAYPLAPRVCEVCQDRRRKEAQQRLEWEREQAEKRERYLKAAEEARLKAQYERDSAAKAESERQRLEYQEWLQELEEAKAREEQERSKREAERLEAERLAKEEAARIEIERLMADQREGPAYLTETGDLRIPRYSLLKHRWWKPEGQSLYLTLAELNAPVQSWRKYSIKNSDLITEKHRGWCTGTIQSGQGFRFCVECGYYWEEELS